MGLRWHTVSPWDKAEMNIVTLLSLSSLFDLFPSMTRKAIMCKRVRDAQQELPYSSAIVPAHAYYHDEPFLIALHRLGPASLHEPR